jgi:hypothetical protein
MTKYTFRGWEYIKNCKTLIYYPRRERMVLKSTRIPTTTTTATAATKFK